MSGKWNSHRAQIYPPDNQQSAEGAGAAIVDMSPPNRVVARSFPLVDERIEVHNSDMSGSANGSGDDAGLARHPRLHLPSTRVYTHTVPAILTTPYANQELTNSPLSTLPRYLTHETFRALRSAHLFTPPTYPSFSTTSSGVSTDERAGFMSARDTLALDLAKGTAIHDPEPSITHTAVFELANRPLQPGETLWNVKDRRRRENLLGGWVARDGSAVPEADVVNAEPEPGAAGVRKGMDGGVGVIENGKGDDIVGGKGRTKRGKRGGKKKRGGRRFSGHGQAGTAVGAWVQSGTVGAFGAPGAAGLGRDVFENDVEESSGDPGAFEDTEEYLLNARLHMGRRGSLDPRASEFTPGR
ncbi:hypothetical protein BKA63DRAFT_72010 [Paraphoma chrysanthemicola]|nr:hypothetical protein BKA63DRAFT_72010 [Paraphoma chrysanthemicola]